MYLYIYIPSDFRLSMISMKKGKIIQEEDIFLFLYFLLLLLVIYLFIYFGKAIQQPYVNI